MSDAPSQIPRITDANLDEVARGERGVLILTTSDCGHCATYAREVADRLGDADFEGVAVGKMVLDAGGSLGFKRKNPWVAKLPTLPYTLLFVDGKAVDHFATSKASYLAERLRRIPAASSAA